MGDHLHAISFPQRLDQPIRATDRDFNGPGVILQREGGGATLSSQLSLGADV